MRFAVFLFKLYMVASGHECTYLSLEEAEAERPTSVKELLNPDDYWVIFEPGNPDPIRHYGLKEIILEGVEENFFVSPLDGCVDIELDSCGIDKRISAPPSGSRSWTYNGKKLGKGKLIAEIATHIAQEYAAEFTNPHSS